MAAINQIEGYYGSNALFEAAISFPSAGNLPQPMIALCTTSGRLLYMEVVCS